MHLVRWRVADLAAVGDQHPAPLPAQHERGAEPRGPTADHETQLRSVQPTGFPEPVDAMPFLPTESTRMAADLSLDELRFYTAYASEAIPTTLAMAWADDPEFRDDYVEPLTQAAKSDLQERDPYYVLTALVPTAAGVPPSLTLRTRDPYQLSGVVAALTAEAVLQEKINPGAHFADSVLDPADIAEALQGDPLVQSLSIQGRATGEHRQ
ncbi:hypothetical protein GCM10025787_24220 [Saccharopolyspora rosea]